MLNIEPSQHHIILIRFAMFAVLGALSACMIPYPVHKVYEGTEIKAEALQWINIGETARVQVLEKLGEPDIDFAGQRAIAYAWSGQKGGVLMVAPNAASSAPIKSRRALMIRFDANDKVAAFSIIGRPTEIIPYDVKVVSLDAKYDDWRVILEQWLTTHGRKITSTGEEQK